MIQNLGFPISCVIGLAMYIIKQQNLHDQEMKKLVQKYEGQNKEFATIIRNNTDVLIQISTIMNVLLNKHIIDDEVPKAC